MFWRKKRRISKTMSKEDIEDLRLALFFACKFVYDHCNTKKSVAEIHDHFIRMAEKEREATKNLLKKMSYGIRYLERG